MEINKNFNKNSNKNTNLNIKLNTNIDILKEIEIRKKRGKQKAREFLKYRAYVKKYYKNIDITSFWRIALSKKHLKKCNKALYQLEYKAYAFNKKKLPKKFSPKFKRKFKIKDSHSYHWISLKKFHTIIYNFGKTGVLWKYCNEWATSYTNELKELDEQNAEKKDKLMQIVLKKRPRKSKFMTLEKAKKIAWKWHKPSKRSRYKLPYLWTPKQIIAFAAKYLYELKPYDRAALTLLWYFRYNIWQLKQLEKRTPKTVRRFIGLFCYEYGVGLSKLDFLSIARYTSERLRRQHIKKIRSIKRGPSSKTLTILKYLKSKWNQEDIMIYLFMLSWWLMPIVYVCNNLYQLLQDSNIAFSFEQEFFNLQSTWQEIDDLYKEEESKEKEQNNKTSEKNE